jgi:hypothetical protein
MALVCVSLGKKYEEQVIYGMFFLKSFPTPGHSMDFEIHPQGSFTQRQSLDAYYSLLLVWKLFNHCLYICFNQETVNLLAHNVPEASHYPYHSRKKLV